eukprot:sb/3473801/
MNTDVCPCPNFTADLPLEDTFEGFTPAVFYLLILLNVLIIVITVVGNGIVIYGVRVYNVAIVTDRTSITFLENLAIADILIAIIFYVPNTLTLIFGKWVLGETLCFANAFFTATPSVAEIWLLMAISLYRIYLVKRPFNRGHVRRR